MIEIISRNHVKKGISFLLIVVMLWVYATSDNYAFSQIPDTNMGALDGRISGLKEYGAEKTESIRQAEANTGLGKASESLKDGYAALAASCLNKKDLNAAVDNFSFLVNTHKAQVIAQLKDTENGTAEFKAYRRAILSSFDELESCISELRTGNTEEALRKIKERVAAEKPYMALADDLPFGIVANDKVPLDTYLAKQPMNYRPEHTEESPGNLESTNDTAVNDKIRSEFKGMTGALDIYQFIKNNYMPEFYYGSRKGAVGAFEQKAGNDYDLASLLIGVLRDRDIPARYVRGRIEITAEQAKRWTATDDIHVALRVIAALGIPVTGLTSGGDIVAVRLEHVWVEAYVPYTDYRGAGTQAGECLWIPLDPSFKEVVWHEGEKISSLKEYMNDKTNFLTAGSEIYGVDAGKIASQVNGHSSAVVKYLLENGYGDATKEEVFGGREITAEELGYLPLTLPYSIQEKMNTFDDVPLDLTDSISFSLKGNAAFDLSFTGPEAMNRTFYTPDLYGKRITLAYVPATDADRDVLAKYGGIFKTPAYLLKLKPQLLVDGIVVAEGPACNAGYMQQYTIKTHSVAPGRNEEVVENSIVAGGIYCIALDYGTISADELQRSADSLEALKATVSEANIYTDAAMGEMLNGIAKAYFAQLDIYNAVAAGQNDVTSTRDLSVGIVGFNVNVIYTFSRPAELNEGGIFLDIGHDVHSVVSNDNNNKNEKIYMLQSGMYASAMEHGILEQITGIESVSTIKALEYAAEQGIPIHAVVKENVSDELDELDISAQLKQEIRSAVNSGRLVIIPEREITLNQWSGVGYMVLDPDTFACGYMISGGLAGGAMTAGQVIEEYVEYVAGGLITMVLYELVKAVALSFLPFGWVGAAFMIFEITMLLLWVYNIVMLVEEYFATGDVSCLQEALIQLASALTVAAIMPKIRPKIEELKNAVADTVKQLKQKPEYPANGGACFPAGTQVSAAIGFLPIEAIKAGDMVESFDPHTRMVSQKRVEEAFVLESQELVHVKVGNDTITATPEHPFYVLRKGFVEAVKLRAGDVFYTVNGEYVVVEQIQHEILESPVKVYNFRVADNHTYFVGSLGVGVHNAECGSTEPEKYEPTQELINHITKGNGKAPSGTKGIDGAHNAKEFYKQAEELGCKIIEETEIETGIKFVKYQVPAHDGLKPGNPIIEGQWKAQLHYKTIYDPKVIPDEVFIKRGFEAFYNWRSNNPNTTSLPRVWRGTDNNGLQWVGFFDSNGNPSNFYPEPETLN